MKLFGVAEAKVMPSEEVRWEGVCGIAAMKAIPNPGKSKTKYDATQTLVARCRLPVEHV